MFFLFFKEFWKNDPSGIEIAPFTGWSGPVLQLCGDTETSWAGVRNDSEGSVGGSLPARCVPHSAAHTDVVLLLRHLWRNTNTDLMKPLVAAAITLDPVHLVTKSRETGFSEENGIPNWAGQPQGIPAGRHRRPLSQHWDLWHSGQAKRVELARQPPQPSQSRPSSRDCFGVETAPPCGKQRAPQRHPSHLLSAGAVDAGGAGKGEKGRVRVSSRKGRRPRSDGERSISWGRGARAAIRISSEQEAERAEARPSSRGS